MNHDNLRRSLEASRFYYDRMYEAMRPEHEKIRIEQKQILSGLYREVMGMETRLQAMEAEFGYVYRPPARYPFKSSDGDDSEPWNGTDDGDFDEDDADSEQSQQLAQEVFPPLLEEPPIMVRPPLEEFPQDPTVPPGPGYEWRGPDEPGGPRGGWFKPDTGESLHPDMDHGPPQGPHYDYKDPDGNQFRWYPDGTMEPKVVVGGEIA